MNLKAQKGATGIDIVISIATIVLTVAVVSMIYVNTTLQSRNVARTAGATRIATNILENIEKISYEDFISEYDDTEKGWVLIDSENEKYSEYPNYKSISKTGDSTPTIFNTKIPKGYTIYMKCEPTYGSYYDSENPNDPDNLANQFDLVRDIKLIITYNVGATTEKLDFSTSKTREIIKEVNEPNTDILYAQNAINTKKTKFYPIKYSDVANAYIKTTEDDLEWYNYSNKRWAMVLVSSKSENQLFDVNGKIITTDSNDKKWVWIPRYFYTEEDSSKIFSEFAFLTTDKAIKPNQELESNGSSKLIYTTYGDRNPDTPEQDSEFFNINGKSVIGKWVQATNITTDDEADILNSSQYGPCEIH